MTSAGRAALLLGLGLIVGRLTVEGSYGNFVQQRMRWPLAIAALCMIVLGVIDLVRWLRAAREDEASVAPAVGGLLVVPLLVLMSVAPAALGAAAADRVDPYEPPPPDAPVWTLPEADPFEMRVLDFVNHVLYDERRGLEGRSVILEGLVVNDDEVPDGFLLVRFLVSCCAADGIPLKVALRGTPERFDDDTWVRVVVTWLPPEVPFGQPGAPKYIEAQIETVDIIPDPPDSPYESPF